MAPLPGIQALFGIGRNDRLSAIATLPPELPRLPLVSPPPPSPSPPPQVVIQPEEFSKELLAAKYECQFCGKRFNRPSSLKIHVNTHTGEKPYVCSFPSCGRRFSVMSNMRRHSRVHASPPAPEWRASDDESETGPTRSSPLASPRVHPYAPPESALYRLPLVPYAP